MNANFIKKLIYLCLTTHKYMEEEIFFQHAYLIYLLSWDKGNYVKLEGPGERNLFLMVIFVTHILKLEYIS